MAGYFYFLSYQIADSSFHPDSIPANSCSDFCLSAGYNGQIRKSKNDAKNSTANVICGVLLVDSMTASAAITYQYEKDVTDLTVTDNRAGIKPGAGDDGKQIPGQGGMLLILMKLLSELKLIKVILNLN